jgi:hypothetical protein
MRQNGSSFIVFWLVTFFLQPENQHDSDEKRRKQEREKERQPKKFETYVIT